MNDKEVTQTIHPSGGLASAPKTFVRWTPEEVAILQSPFDSMRGLIAALPGRCEVSIRSKAYRSGLRPKVPHRERTHPSHSPDDLEIIRSTYLRYGIVAATKALPHLTHAQIYYRLRKHEIRSTGHAIWGQAEIARLTEVYENEGTQAALRAFPEFGTRIVLQKIKNLPIKRKGYQPHAVWTAEEDAFLRSEYNTLGAAGCHRSKLRHRTPGSISSRAYSIGITSRKSLNWSEEEDSIIRSKFPDGGCRAVAPLLPLRDSRQISIRANQLRVKADIVNRYRNEGYDVIAEHLPNFTRMALYRYCTTHGIAVKRPPKVRRIPQNTYTLQDFEIFRT